MSGEIIGSIVASLGILLVIAIVGRKDPNQGRNTKIHLVYIAASLLFVLLLPSSVAAYIFTQLTVTLVGFVYPIYRATKAVCTPDDDDDKVWLQYWQLGGVLFMLTSWIDDAIESEVGDQKLLGSLLFTFYWLYCPFTCGALLIYERVTAPFLAPKLRPMQKKMSNFIAATIQALTNAAHLYFVWIIFMFLPSGLKRICAITIGTVYPFVCSVTATATDEIEDDTYWLTYWAAYGCLFLIMDTLEVFIGWVPGFYTLVIFTTVYLMLPMFRGADKVFRKILVPLAGLQEMLILRDTIMIKKEMLRNLDPERAEIVEQQIAKLFSGSNNSSDPTVLKGELKNSWNAIKIKNPFRRKKDGYDAPPDVKEKLNPIV